MYKSHPEFKLDKVESLPLWKYMDFWKFLHLANSSHLFFSSIPTMGDQHEGRIPKKVYDQLEQQANKAGWNKDTMSNYKGFLEHRLRPGTYVCSWSASATESFAMWKMYAKEKLGVAIKTTCERLKTSFDKTERNVYIGEVIYYDDQAPKYQISNIFYSFLVKHNYYQFESEVRCIISGTQDAPPSSLLIPVDLNELIEEIYISPFAYETGLAEIVEFVKAKQNILAPVKISGVNDTWL